MLGLSWHQQRRGAEHGNTIVQIGPRAAKGSEDAIGCQTTSHQSSAAYTCARQSYTCSNHSHLIAETKVPVHILKQHYSPNFRQPSLLAIVPPTKMPGFSSNEHRREDEPVAMSKTAAHSPRATHSLLACLVTPVLCAQHVPKLTAATSPLLLSQPLVAGWKLAAGLLLLQQLHSLPAAAAACTPSWPAACWLHS